METTDLKIKILIVEDDTRVSELIKRGLAENNYAADVAFDGISGKELFIGNNYQLVITDIMLPGINGIELCKEISRIKPDIPILMLTALGETDDKIEGFDAGADDYLVKPFEMRELLARVKVLLRRNNHSIKHDRTDIISYADLEINLHTKIIRRGGQEINLTPKEFKLMEFMIRNPERVLSRSEISEKVWGTNFDTGTNFIDVYINYLRKKIDREHHQKLIHTKPGMGFILKST